MLFDLKMATIDHWNDPLFVGKQVRVDVLRLDKIHPVVSGNKLFKLHYFLEQAMQSAKGILTFGGAYSNHLVATAFACRKAGIPCVAIVRGQAPSKFSHTLDYCKELGMQLKFISRENYTKKEDPDFLEQINQEFAKMIIVPEGGFHPLGAQGASLIFDAIQENEYSHFCAATGTATTIAGLLLGQKKQQIISVPVLKNMTDLYERIDFLIGEKFEKERFLIFEDYHFGGYAKKTPELIEFMNEVWRQSGIPTDFVYTGKMLFAIFDKIKRDYFERGSRILCVHTGGLQGNDSLRKGALDY